MVKKTRSKRRNKGKVSKYLKIRRKLGNRDGRKLLS